MLGNSGPGHREVTREFGHALFSTRQKLEQGPPGRLRGSLQNIRHRITLADTNAFHKKEFDNMLRRWERPHGSASSGHPWAKFRPFAVRRATMGIASPVHVSCSYSWIPRRLGRDQGIE